jgi:hypothetical protein
MATKNRFETGGYLDRSQDFQAGPLGMDLGFSDERADGGCPSLKLESRPRTWNLVPFELSVWLRDFWCFAPKYCHFYVNAREGKDWESRKPCRQVEHRYYPWRSWLATNSLHSN